MNSISICSPQPLISLQNIFPFYCAPRLFKQPLFLTVNLRESIPGVKETSLQLLVGAVHIGITAVLCISECTHHAWGDIQLGQNHHQQNTLLCDL